MSLHHMQIGEVADRIGLSLRTIRYYEQVGLVTPSSRTTGGFRLYTETDVARLQLVKRMKPLEFSLEQMKDLLGILDALEDGEPGQLGRTELLERLAMYRVAADARVTALRDHLAVAEQFAGDLRREIGRQKKLAGRRK